jgi:hypothetical protein
MKKNNIPNKNRNFPINLTCYQNFRILDVETLHNFALFSFFSFRIYLFWGFWQPQDEAEEQEKPKKKYNISLNLQVNPFHIKQT